MFRHASLFSGIGRFDLAASWMNWQNIFFCEIDPFCQRILKHYWPNTPLYEDIHHLDPAQYRGRIDIISGGFPCQPFSQVGKRQGKSDDRYLWPQTLRIIEATRPRWIVLENVTGLFTILEQESISEMEIKEIELFCSDKEYSATRTIVSLQRRIIASIISEINAAGYVFPRLQDGTPVVLCIPACSVGHHIDGTEYGLLPTPIARDWKGPTPGNKIDNLPGAVRYLTGSTGQLNPLFAGEMMGFPEKWTVLPFQNGEPKV